MFCFIKTICISKGIGLDKSGYQVNIFLISPRRGASNKYHNICFRGEIRKISIVLD